jgi:hypothetical protein
MGYAFSSSDDAVLSVYCHLHILWHIGKYFVNEYILFRLFLSP